jgi:hypothetical protein
MATTRLAAMPAIFCVTPDGQASSTEVTLVSDPRPKANASSLCEA